MIATPQERLDRFSHVLNSGTGKYCLEYDIGDERKQGLPVYTDKLEAEADAKALNEKYDAISNVVVVSVD